MRLSNHLCSPSIITVKEAKYKISDGKGFYKPLNSDWMEMRRSAENLKYMASLGDKIYFFNDDGVFSTPDNGYIMEKCYNLPIGATVNNVTTVNDRFYICLSTGVLEYDLYDDKWRLEIKDDLDPANEITYLLLTNIDDIERTIFTGKDENGFEVFEKKIDTLLKDKAITIISKKIFDEIVDETLEFINNKYDFLLNKIISLPDGRDEKFCMNELIFKTKLLTEIHNEKLKIRDPLTELSFEEFSNMDLDPTKSKVVGSVLVDECGEDNYVPLFNANFKNGNIENNGKLLLKFNISSPEMVFDGYITSKGKEIEFISENLISKFENTEVKLVPIISNNFCIIGINYKTSITSDLDKLKTFKFVITPLISGAITIRSSFNKQFPFDSSIIKYYGDLNENGRGSITKSFINDSSIKSDKVFYESDSPSDRKSKISNLEIYPDSFNSEIKDETIGSCLLSSPFKDQNSNFDLYGLLKSVYGIDNGSFESYGYIIVNDYRIPIIGFYMDATSSSVSFYISPYFKIPPNDLEIVPMELNGDRARLPYIVFKTNSLLDYDESSSGFIGDVGVSNNKILLGSDSSNRNKTLYKSDYGLKYINITTIFNKTNTIVNDLNKGDEVRYSGDFNKFKYNFLDRDYDTYPFPFENRDITGIMDTIDHIPVEGAVPKILLGIDGVPMVWMDDSEYIRYISK